MELATPTNKHMIETPIFLIGAERSGTSLMRLILDHHPQIAFQFEFELAVDCVGNNGEFPAIEEYIDWLDTNRIFHHSQYSINPALDYPHLVNDFLRQKQAKSGNKPILGATVHRHYARLQHIWPAAKYIHIVRDGRDVAQSMVGMGWAGHPWVSCAKWLESEQEIEALKSKIAPENWIEIRYETLLENSEAELDRICQFMGTRFDPKMFDYIRNSSYEKPDPKLAYQWRRKMPERDLRLVESRIGDMLLARGYPLSGLPPIPSNRLLSTQITLQSKLHCAVGRIKRYGTNLYLTDFIARRLGMKQLQTECQHKINAIDERHIR